MAGIEVRAIKARAILRCDRCGNSEASAPYAPMRWGDEVRACADAFADGWRVYAGGRSWHTYCPRCGPTVPMHLLHGTEPTNSGVTQ